MPSFNFFPILSLSLVAGCHGFVPSVSHSIRLTPSSESHHRMFTGIVEEMGTVVALEERDDMPLWDGSTGKGTELVVEGKVVMDGAYLG